MGFDRLSPKARLSSFAATVITLVLALVPAHAQTNDVGEVPPAPAESQRQDTNSAALLLLCQELQEQLWATQAAIEASRMETKAAAAQTAEALSNAFHMVEETFAAQRAQDLAAITESNHVTLIVAGTFAGVGFLTMLLVGYFQWRMSKGLAEISSVLPTAMGLGTGSSPHVLPLHAHSAESAAIPALSHAKEEQAGSGRAKELRGASNARAGSEKLASAAVAGLGMSVAADQTERSAPAPVAVGQPAVLPHGAASAAEIRFFPSPAPVLRKRPVRALRTAIIVGLICAAFLALLFYVVTYQKPGGGGLYNWFRH